MGELDEGDKIKEKGARGKFIGVGEDDVLPGTDMRLLWSEIKMHCMGGALE